MTVTDGLNRVVELTNTPKRIVSLVPSQTELLHYLGLEDEVIGITKFCVHPKKWFQQKTRIGGTKTLNIDKIKELQPHLIIANKEENAQEQIEALTKYFPVWVSDVNSLHDAYKMITGIGEITGKAGQAETLITQIKTNFSDTQLQSIIYKPRTCYLIWKEPYMTIGGDTFISDLLNKAGFENIFQNKLRYPETSIAELSTLNCEVLLLSSEPYPFKQAHIEEIRDQLQATKIILANGEIFSWYGSRLLQAPTYFRSLHQQLKAIV
jgi:ABC-type Fe3+-hydroxamate transport system substrate-binding protein